MEEEMTREEIEKMVDGWDMDALIADKVMGWKRGVFDKESGDYIIYSSGIVLKQVGKWPMHSYEKWEPSKDISAAWQVVEKMLQNAHSKEFREFREELNGIEIHLYESRLAALHICRAALLAVEPRREEGRER